MPSTDEPTVTEVADLCIRARQALGSSGSRMLRLLLDMILLELSRQLAVEVKAKREDGSSTPANGSGKPAT